MGFTNKMCAEPDPVDSRLTALAQVMLKTTGRETAGSTRHGARSVETGEAWPERALRVRAYTAHAGLCGPDVCRGPLGSCSLGARASGTAAVNKPKSHLKGTLCPASNTQSHADS